MQAVDPVPVVQTTTQQPDVIEIVGTRANQTQKIDRRTYRVQQNPHSAQKDAIQLLRGLPAVTISPDNSVVILGNPNVTILVDGRPYPGDSRQYLRTLHGDDIERIEIVTNPSAQFSSEGTGGIVNFVLRRQRQGISGNASIQASSLGHGTADATLKDKRGKWTYEVEAHAWGGRASRTSYQRLRSVEQAPGGTPSMDSEDGRQSLDDVSGELSGKLTYDLSPNTSFSAKLDSGGFASTTRTNADFTGLTPDFASFSERQRDRKTSSLLFAQLNFDHKGAKDGESLTAGINIYGHPSTRDTTSGEFSNGGSFSSDHRQHLFGVYSQVDWQQPVGKGEIFSMGGVWNYRRLDEHYSFEATGSGSSLGSNSLDQYSAVNNTLAAYATFQQPIGGWAAMPGLRIEQYNRRISSLGLPEVRMRATYLFPTLHLERALGNAFNFTLSYSKRIDRTDEEMLRPYRSVEDALNVFQGNPRLKDQLTDAFEANLHYHHRSIDAGLILYDRETSRLWSKAYFAIGGINVYTWVNSGRRSDRGAEFDVNAPLAKRLKINASVNLFQELAPVDATSGSARENDFRYATNTTLEWDGADRGRTPGDVVQLQWIYASPSRQFQLRNFASNWLGLTFTHSFSQSVSVTSTLEYSGRERHRLLAPLVQEDYAAPSPLNFKLKLTKSLGRP